MTTKTIHTQASVLYMRDAVRDRERRGLSQHHITRNGQPVSFADAYTELQTMRDAGLVYFPCCGHTSDTGLCLGIEND